MVAQVAYQRKGTGWKSLINFRTLRSYNVTEKMLLGDFRDFCHESLRVFSLRHPRRRGLEPRLIIFLGFINLRIICFL